MKFNANKARAEANVASQKRNEYLNKLVERFLAEDVEPVLQKQSSLGNSLARTSTITNWIRLDVPYELRQDLTKDELETLESGVIEELELAGFNIEISRNFMNIKW